MTLSLGLRKRRIQTNNLHWLCLLSLLCSLFYFLTSKSVDDSEALFSPLSCLSVLQFFMHSLSKSYPIDLHTIYTQITLKPVSQTQICPLNYRTIYPTAYLKIPLEYPINISSLTIQNSDCGVFSQDCSPLVFVSRNSFSAKIIFMFSSALPLTLYIQSIRDFQFHL